ALPDRKAVGAAERRGHGGVSLPAHAVQREPRQRHPARAGALRGELRFVGGEVLRDPVGEHSAFDFARAIGPRGRSLVPGGPGHQRHGPGAGPSFLAAVRVADGGPEGPLGRGGRAGAQPQKPDRAVQQEAGAGRSELDAGSGSAAPGGFAPRSGPGRAKRVNRLRNRLILIFLAATLAPLAATVWITTSLLEFSLDFSSTTQLDNMAKSLQRTGHEFYQHVRDDLKQQAGRPLGPGALQPRKYTPKDRANWPPAVRAFAESEEPEQFLPAGHEGDQLDYLVRHGDEVWSYSASLGGMERLTVDREIRDARKLVDNAKEHDWRRGFKLAYVLLAASIWLASLALLVYLAHRISRPIQQLTAGLTELAAGDLNARVEARRDDE